MKLFACGVLLLSFAVSGSAASIAGSRNSTNYRIATLEKQSRHELRSASRALRSARLAYRDGDRAGLIETLLAVERRVVRAYESLVQTGENPRESPEAFKEAETHLRRLCRRLEFFQTEVSIQDRSVLEAVTVKIEKLQHELLMGIASGTRAKLDSEPD